MCCVFCLLFIYKKYICDCFLFRFVFHFIFIILPHQIEEDVGSAEEQPTSNKFGTYTKNEAVKTAFFISFFGMSYG